MDKKLDRYQFLEDEKLHRKIMMFMIIGGVVTLSILLFVTEILMK